MLKTEKCFLFQLRNIGEEIRRFVFGKFVETCRELNNRNGNVHVVHENLLILKFSLMFKFVNLNLLKKAVLYAVKHLLENMQKTEKITWLNIIKKYSVKYANRLYRINENIKNT